MDQRETFIRSMLGETIDVIVDRPIGYRHGTIVYPINYGFLPGVMGGDGEEQDVYIMGVSSPISTFHGHVIGAIRRKNDIEDKLVVAPEGVWFHQGEIAQAVQFQEQYFDSFVISVYHKSCGVLPWRKNQGKKEFLVVFETYSKCWSLPKGHIEAGETEEMAALRELQEETGLTAKLDTTKRAVIQYSLHPIGHKQVVFFPGEVIGEAQGRPGEIDGLKWITEEQLEDYLFPDTVKACKKLIDA